MHFSCVLWARFTLTRVLELRLRKFPSLTHFAYVHVWFNIIIIGCNNISLSILMQQVAATKNFSMAQFSRKPRIEPRFCMEMHGRVSAACLLNAIMLWDWLTRKWGAEMTSQKNISPVSINFLNNEKFDAFRLEILFFQCRSIVNLKYVKNLKLLNRRTKPAVVQ